MKLELIELIELTDTMRDVDFKIFSAPAPAPANAKDGRVVALRVPGGGALTRGRIHAYGQFVSIYGARGLAWIKVNDAARGREGLRSSRTCMMRRSTRS